MVLRRWSTTSKALLLLALACGMAAFLIVRGYAARLEALRPAVGEPIAVVAAAVDLARGSQVEVSSLEVVEVPSALVPPGAVVDPAEAAGRTLLSPVAAGEVLTRTRLAEPGQGPVAALVPPGLRAFVVAPPLPSGSVVAGDRVDVLATFGGGRPHTETVASGLEVALVMEPDAATSVPAPGAVAAPALVLLVSPQQAERLAYVSAFAELSVSVAGAEPLVPYTSTGR